MTIDRKDRDEFSNDQVECDDVGKNNKPGTKS